MIQLRSKSPVQTESEQIVSALKTVFRTRKRFLLLCVLGVLVPVLAFNQFATPVYEASTSLIFEDLTPPTQEIAAEANREYQTSNRIEEMNSLSFAEDLVRALPDDSRGMIPIPPNTPPADSVKAAGGTLHEDGLLASPLRDTDIVRVRVRTKDPQLSTELANLVPAVLQDRSNRVRREGASGLRSYVNDQLAQSENRLKDSEDKLRAYKESHKVSSLEGESAQTLQKLTEAEVLLNTTRSDRVAAERSLKAVRGTISSQRKAIVPDVTNTASLSSQGMKQRLVTLQQQYAQLSVQGYASDHPRMVQLRQEITEAKRSLAEEAANLTRSGTTSDPIATLDQYSQQALALQVQVQSLRARESSLSRTVSGYKGDLSRLPNLEVGLARLTRERDANQKTYTSLLDNRESIRVAQGNQVPNARVVDWAEEPKDPIFPRKLLNLALGLALGLMVGSGIGLYQESGRTGLRSVVVFEDTIGWPVLARVPAARLGPGTRVLPPGGAVAEISDGDSQRALISHSDPASAQGEAYFMLRTRLELLGFGTKYRSLLVTSTAPRDGKSSTLCNLATTFGTAGRSALVVDAELRRPVIHRYFGVNQWPGLSDLLLAQNGNGNHMDPLPPHLFQPTPVPGVDVLACGRRMTEFEWESRRPRTGALLEELKSRYDVVLVDSAPPVLVHDTLALCSLVDAVLVVVNAKRYDTRHLIETKRLLEQAGANILGVVINRVESYGTYSYYYDRRYGPREPGDSPMTSRS